MRFNPFQIGLFLIILTVALALRLPQLAQRPMHTDEAVHAIKFGDLLEQNHYRYDPVEYHGPTLNYFTLIPAWLRHQTRLVKVTETTLRSVPLFFGLLLFVFILMLRPYFPLPAWIGMSLWTAISPAMVFYSRYYIMETMLVALAFAFIVSLFRYVHEIRHRWLLLAAVSLGLMMATKETWIISLGAMVMATIIPALHRRTAMMSALKRIPGIHLVIAAVVTIVTAGLFFSSFGSNWHGLIDAIQAYTIYFQRAGGNQSSHVHPWYSYLHWLLAYRQQAGHFFSELIILISSIPAIWHSFRLKQPTAADHFIRWLAWYSLFLALAYAAIPYKTPWNLLNFWQPIIILAGNGIYHVCSFAHRRWRRIMSAIILIGALHLGWLSWRTNFPDAAARSNPYVYGHTSPDIYKLVQAVHNATRAAATGDSTYIEVICPNNDYWPLPWYFRKYHYVGYRSRVNMDTPAAPIIIAMPSVEPELMKKLYQQPPPGQRNLYLPLTESYLELRPGVEIRSYIIKELWDHLP